MGLREQHEKGRQPIKDGLMSGLLLQTTRAQSHWELWEMMESTPPTQGVSKPEYLCTNFRSDAHGGLFPCPPRIVPGSVAWASKVPRAQYSSP